jgi:hypothetical protein
MHLTCRTCQSSPRHITTTALLFTHHPPLHSSLPPHRRQTGYPAEQLGQPHDASSARIDLTYHQPAAGASARTGGFPPYPSPTASFLNPTSPTPPTLAQAGVRQAQEQFDVGRGAVAETPAPGLLLPRLSPHCRRSQTAFRARATAYPAA